MGNLFGTPDIPAPVVATPAPAPAPAVEEATVREVDEGEVGTKKKKAQALGAKSLQIPLAGSIDTGTVGTV